MFEIWRCLNRLLNKEEKRKIVRGLRLNHVFVFLLGMRSHSTSSHLHRSAISRKGKKFARRRNKKNEATGAEIYAHNPRFILHYCAMAS